MCIRFGMWPVYLVVTAACLFQSVHGVRAEQALPAAQRSDAIIIALDPVRAPGFTQDLVAALRNADSTLKLNIKDGYSSLRRVDADLALGEVGAFLGIRYSDERAKVLNFVKEVPLYCIDYRLAMRMDDPLEPANLDDIRASGPGSVVLTLQGRLYTELLKSQPGLRVDDGTASVEASLQKLLDHRGRFFYADSNLLKHYIKKLGLEDTVRIAPTIFESDALYPVASKFLDSKSFQKLRAALIALDKNGELTRIRAANKLRAPKFERGQESTCATKP